MPRRDTKARRVQIVAQWQAEKEARTLKEEARTLPVRERVARALACPTQEQMAKDLSETFSDDEIRVLAAQADLDNPKRRKGGRPKKRPDLQLIEAVATVQRQAADRGERLTDWAACMLIPTLPAYRKQFSAVNGEALYKRFQRALRR